MTIKVLMTGMFESNSYVLGSLGEGALIDAGVSSKEVLNVIAAENLKLKYIILTHAHIDHIASLEEIRKATGAKVMVHSMDAGALVDAYSNGSSIFGESRKFAPADVMLAEGDEIVLGEETLSVLHTPGHSKGGICIKAGNVVFTGDTLFRTSIGRSDLDGGDGRQLLQSIKIKLMALPDDTVVYPGHGPKSTVGFEKTHNYFLTHNIF